MEGPSTVAPTWSTTSPETWPVVAWLAWNMDSTREVELRMLPNSLAS
jgi:hypothetical protein